MLVATLRLALSLGTFGAMASWEYAQKAGAV